MYCETNFLTKKAMREAVERKENVRVYQPGPFPSTMNGEAAIEGPHYPLPHKWYAKVQVENGVITKVLK